jgi:hypothetical protein
MTIARRLTTLERRATAHDTTVLLVPFIWRLRDEDVWRGIPSDAECAELGAALAVAGVAPVMVTWLGDVPSTLAALRLSAAGPRRGVRTCRVVRSPPPYKAYVGLNPHEWLSRDRGMS